MGSSNEGVETFAAVIQALSTDGGGAAAGSGTEIDANGVCKSVLASAKFYRQLGATEKNIMKQRLVSCLKGELKGADVDRFFNRLNKVLYQIVEKRNTALDEIMGNGICEYQSVKQPRAELKELKLILQFVATLHSWLESKEQRKLALDLVKMVRMRIISSQQELFIRQDPRYHVGDNRAYWFRIAYFMTIHVLNSLNASGEGALYDVCDSFKVDDKFGYEDSNKVVADLVHNLFLQSKDHRIRMLHLWDNVVKMVAEVEEISNVVAAHRISFVVFCSLLQFFISERTQYTQVGKGYVRSVKALLKELFDAAELMSHGFVESGHQSKNQAGEFMRQFLEKMSVIGRDRYKIDHLLAVDRTEGKQQAVENAWRQLLYVLNLQHIEGDPIDKMRTVAQHGVVPSQFFRGAGEIYEGWGQICKYEATNILVDFLRRMATKWQPPEEQEQDKYKDPNACLGAFREIIAIFAGVVATNFAFELPKLVYKPAAKAKIVQERTGLMLAVRTCVMVRSMCIVRVLSPSRKFDDMQRLLYLMLQATTGPTGDLSSEPSHVCSVRSEEEKRALKYMLPLLSCLYDTIVKKNWHEQDISDAPVELIPNSINIAVSLDQFMKDIPGHDKKQEALVNMTERLVQNLFTVSSRSDLPMAKSTVSMCSEMDMCLLVVHAVLCSFATFLDKYPPSAQDQDARITSFSFILANILKGLKEKCNGYQSLIRYWNRWCTEIWRKFQIIRVACEESGLDDYVLQQLRIVQGRFRALNARSVISKLHERERERLERHKCAKCGQDAQKKCERCRRTYYCSRPCQKEDWKEHKATCVQPAAAAGAK